MSRPHSRLWIALVVLLVQGCATTSPNSSLSGLSDTRLQVVENQGVSTLISSQDNSIVKLTAFRTPRKDLMMNLEFENLSSETFDIDPINFRAFAIDSSKKTRTLKIYGPDEFSIMSQKRLRSSGLMVDLLDATLQAGGALVSAAASGAGQVVGIGQQILQGTVTPGMRSGQSSEGTWVNSVFQSYLRPFRMSPRSRAAGTLIAEGASTDKYEIRISIGNDVHVFKLNKPSPPAQVDN